MFCNTETSCVHFFFKIRPALPHLWSPGPSLPRWRCQRRRHCHSLPCQWSAPSQNSSRPRPPSEPAPPWRGWCSSLVVSIWCLLGVGGPPQAGAGWERKNRNRKLQLEGMKLCNPRLWQPLADCAFEITVLVVRDEPHDADQPLGTWPDLYATSNEETLDSILLCMNRCNGILYNGFELQK